MKKMILGLLLLLLLLRLIIYLHTLQNLPFVCKVQTACQLNFNSKNLKQYSKRSIVQETAEFSCLG